MKLPHIRTFSYHYREKYGQPIGKIAIDIGHPCPNREKGGCIFCSSAGFTPAYLQKTDTIAAQIAKGKKFLLKGRFKKYFAYFQQETTTAMAAEQLLPICDLALRDSDCIGIIISTRPDYIEDELLRGLAKVIGSTKKECLIEIGVQSAHEKSLTFLNRNHSFEDVRNAVQRIRHYKVFETGAHLILGIPGENDEDMIATVQTVCEMGINTVKLHHLQVVRDTPLHDMYVRGEVRLFSFEEYSQLLLKILPFIPDEVTIHRLWATSHPDILIAPRWNILAAVLSKKLLGKMAGDGIYQGDKSY